MMNTQALITIEVAYGESQRQHIETLTVKPGTSIKEVLAQPLKLKQMFPNMHIDADAVGLFSKRVSVNTVLIPGDRIEIYRPLLIDPKQARRQRAAKSRH